MIILHHVLHYSLLSSLSSQVRILCLLWLRQYAMEVIVDELRKNNVDIDMAVLSYHIHQCFKQYKTMYEQMAILPVSMVEIFEEMNVNNLGRLVAFLTYVYVLKDVTRRAVRLLATVLIDMDLTAFRVEESFCKECFLGSDVCLHYKLHELKLVLDLMHNDVILWSRRLKSFENGYS